MKLIYIILLFFICEKINAQKTKEYTINQIIDSIKKNYQDYGYSVTVNKKEADSNCLKTGGGYNFIFDGFINGYNFFLQSNFYKNVFLNANFYHDSLLPFINNENFDWVYKRNLLILLQGQNIDKIIELIENVFNSVKKFDKIFNVEDSSFYRYLIRTDLNDDELKIKIDSTFEIHSSVLIDILNQFNLEIYEIHKNFKNKKLRILLDSISDYYSENKTKNNLYRPAIIDICSKIKFGEKYLEYIRKKNILFPPYYENKNGKNVYNIDFYNFNENKIPIIHNNLFLKKLVIAYKEVLKNNGQENQLKYFTIFPDNINSFYNTFSYNKNLKLYSPLIKVYDSFIDLFFNLNKIPKKAFVDKILNLTQNAAWDAKAIEYLNIKIYNYYVDNKKFIDSNLTSKPDTYIEHFFYFVYDKPYFESDLLNYKLDLYEDKQRIEKIKNKVLLKIIKQNKFYFYKSFK